MTAQTKKQDQPTYEQLEQFVRDQQAKIDQLEAQKKQGRQPTMRCVTAEDNEGNVHYAGTAALYGTRQFPLTFFGPELRWILDNVEMLETFLEENKDNISWDKNDETWKARRAKYQEVAKANRAAKA